MCCVSKSFDQDSQHQLNDKGLAFNKTMLPNILSVQLLVNK